MRIKTIVAAVVGAMTLLFAASAGAEDLPLQAVSETATTYTFKYGPVVGAEGYRYYTGQEQGTDVVWTPVSRTFDPDKLTVKFAKGPDRFRVTTQDVTEREDGFMFLAKPQCMDGKDNDGDAKIDYPADPGCSAKNDNSEVNTTPPPPGDTTKPTDPSGLNATNVTQTSYTFNWTASQDNVAVTGYDVFRNGATVGNGNFTTFNNTNLTCNTTYTSGVRAKDAAGNLSNTVTVSVTTAACTTPPPTGNPPPSAGYFTTTTPAGQTGSYPTGASCANQVHRSTWEPRPWNDKRNHVLVDPQAVHNAFSQRQMAEEGTIDPMWDTWLLPRVDGQFQGTTDEIFQWAACKWGVPDNVIRAAAYQESTWYQYLTYPSGRCYSLYGCGDFFSSGSIGADSRVFCDYIDGFGHAYQPDYSVGQCPQTFSILGIKSWWAPAWGYNFPNNQNGTFPFNRDSTAFAADYYGSQLRGCLEGWIEWLGNPPNDLWGCVGHWFSGGWHDPEADRYASEVQGHLNNRVWLQTGFPNDKPGCTQYGCPGPDNL